MESISTFANINNLIIAISKLLWPVISIIIILIFRKEISNLFFRIRKGKLLGQELELDPRVDLFQKTVKKSEQELPEITDDPKDINKEEEKMDSDINEILKASEINPEFGILRLSALIEKEIRIIAASLGDIDSRKQIPVLRQFEVLIQKRRLSQHTHESLKLFWDLRNRIVHGHGVTDKKDVLRILAIGLDFLRTIRDISHKTNVIYNPGVEVYEDNKCTKIRKGVKGLILETTSHDGKKLKRIFATRNFTYYKKGKMVTWEWDLSHNWNETWFIDPDTNQKKMAWSSAGEFTGRHVDEI